MEYHPLLKTLEKLIARKKYELLLVSFLILIFGNTFITIHTAGVFDIYQNFFTGLIVFFYKKWLRFFILLVITFNAGLDVFAKELFYLDLRSWHGIVYIIFFVVISKEVYKEVLYAKTVSRELLAASLCGFVLLCLMGTFIFYQIEIKLPHSFTNAGQKNEILNNLNYFSFTTILTIGYGDIVPLSLVARRAVMFVGLFGHFYTVFVTSIIIGKYLSASNAKG
ncbi:potassium channel family protein [Mucilaginibacter dorajii]|uniref:Potassium channel family protein n=1 Tax=Mucilaginibacter dorajii TaxID=692994 RepID=A0ABP7P7S0_9SPHI|nr:potassium channel family protein [Mucilaginibacter dorajii]MCS3736601.1 hypothetical protein [Mucilaginibacter dorajii]